MEEPACPNQRSVVGSLTSLRASELRSLRLAADLEQKQMARKLELSVRQLRRYERGEKRVPKWLAIAAFCLAHHLGRE